MLKRKLLNDNGFTLIEIIAVLVILGLLSSLAVPRYIDLDKNAKQKAIGTAISEINARETLTWADHKISTSGFVSDEKIFNEINYDLDPDYSWDSGNPTASGGTLNFTGEAFTLSRAASSPLKAAVWIRN